MLTLVGALRPIGLVSCHIVDSALDRNVRWSVGVQSWKRIRGHNAIRAVHGLSGVGMCKRSVGNDGYGVMGIS